MKEKNKKTQSLEDTLQDIRSSFGEESIMTLSEKPNVDIDAIGSGSVGLDHALGIGGFPRGRVVEIYGPEASGKTTMALHVVANAQKAGGIAAYIDAEHALDPQYAKRIGVDISKLLISQPNGGEEALQITEKLVRGGQVAVVVIDSVAALTPRSEIEGQIGDAQMGAQARLMSQALRMLTASIANTNTLVVFINQIRSNIGGYGNPETTAGGRALKFYASVRIDIRRIATIKTGDTAIGSHVKVKVVKNKVAPPFREAEFDIIYNEGISREGEILILGEQLKVIEKGGGAIYTYGGVKLGRGYDATRQYLKENPEVAEHIAKDILASHPTEI